MNEMKRAEVEKARARHKEISEAIIKKDSIKIEKLCGSKKKADKELQELEHFLNYREI